MANIYNVTKLVGFLSRIVAEYLLLTRTDYYLGFQNLMAIKIRNTSVVPIAMTLWAFLLVEK